jgi:hypothetical protein
MLRIIYLLIILLTTSCTSEDSTNGGDNSTVTIEEIIPSNLILTIEILGQNEDNLNGDGSGVISCTASATDAINYEFRFGNGEVVESTTGNIEFTYTTPGLNNYTVYVYAYSQTDNYVVDFQAISVYVNDDTVAGLIWSEEFDEIGAVNNNNWTHEIGNGDWGWGNGESQYYTSRLENSKVEDGVLKITAKTENYQGHNYTSARLISRDKFEFQYGRVDIRAKLPEGQGTWPALWMLGANQTIVGWPACGEIDIMEHWGHNPTVVAGSIHTPYSYGDTWTNGHVNVSDYTEFHIYSINWTSEKIQFFIDNILYYTYNPSPKNIENWPFDEPQFFILNIPMGGSWFDIDPNFVESTMEVDYIRVYDN